MPLFSKKLGPFLYKYLVTLKLTDVALVSVASSVRFGVPPHSVDNCLDIAGHSREADGPHPKRKRVDAVADSGSPPFGPRYTAARAAATPLRSDRVAAIFIM